MAEDAFFPASQFRQTRVSLPLDPRCDACGLYRTCHSPKIKVGGRGRRGILVVGEYPGRDEDREGMHFVGKTGQFVAEVLSDLGTSLHRDCWFTNALICYGTNAGDHKTAVQDCRPNLMRTIRELNPSTIILMGTAAVRSLLGYVWKEDCGPISQWVGWRIPCQELNAWICPTYNPAHTFHKDDPVLKLKFREHLKEAVSLSGAPWPDGAPHYESQVGCIHSPEIAAQRIRQITSGTIAFDIETNMIKPDSKDAEIVCCSVCWDGLQTFAFPWHGEAKNAMIELLQNPDVGKIGANAKYEHRWMKAKHGIDVMGWTWDVMLGAHCLDPRGGVTGLKHQSWVRLGVPAYNAHIEPFLGSREKGGNSSNRVREIQFDQLMKYCGVDSLLTFNVAQHQMREMGVGDA